MELSELEALTTSIIDHLQDPSNGLVHDRYFRLRKYKQCFEAQETITSIVTSKLVKERDSAIIALRRCVETGQIAHVTHDHHFKDQYLFFKLMTNHDKGHLPSLAETKEMEGSKHGTSDVRVKDPVHGKHTTEKNRYIVLSNGTLYEYPNDHSPFPTLILSLAECGSGTVSYCGSLKSGMYGISITPPICESSNFTVKNEGGVEGALSAGELSTGEKKVDQNNDLIDRSDGIVLLFNTVEKQESWLGALVKSGLLFRETASPSASQAMYASSILQFKASQPTFEDGIDDKIIDLNDICSGKVTIIVNVASF
jgi:hypothetical protein